MADLQTGCDHDGRRDASEQKFWMRRHLGIMTTLDLDRQETTENLNTDTVWQPPLCWRGRDLEENEENECMTAVSDTDTFVSCYWL